VRDEHLGKRRFVVKDANDLSTRIVSHSVIAVGGCRPVLSIRPACIRFCLDEEDFDEDSCGLRNFV
jgi:hypothetical protein